MPPLFRPANVCDALYVACCDVTNTTPYRGVCDALYVACCDAMVCAAVMPRIQVAVQQAVCPAQN